MPDSETSAPNPLRAVIDVGSSAVKFAIYDLSARRPRLVQEGDPVTTTLGCGLLPGGPLEPEARRRTIACILDFRDRIAAAGAELDLIAGTAALRKTGERGEFVRELRRLLGPGPEIRVISAEEEARWARLSARTMLDLDAEPRLLVDPGGSSNDFALLEGETFSTATLSFGMNDLLAIARVSEEEARVDDEARARLLDFLRDRYAELGEFLGSGPAPRELIGTSGAAIALGAVHRGVDRPDRQSRLLASHDHRLSIADIRTMAAELAPLQAAERRRRHPCLAPTRSQIFVHGALIYVALLEALGLEELRINGYGMKLGGLIALRDGV
ncbi:MAG: hypothetical protein H6807_11205 [Planctomycetes bacterium]|nr:hypothetical protein [Planctomycetota bacterium]